jgi:hypothetical protein
LVSLSVLRSEAVSTGQFAHADRIAEIIRAANARVVPPPSSVRTGSTQSPRSTGGFQSISFIPTVDHWPDSPPGESISDDDFQQFSQMIDALLNGDQPIVFEDDVSRSKLLRVLADRSEVALHSSDYGAIKALDRLYDQVQRSGQASGSRARRIAQLRARRTALVERRETVEQQKEAALEETRASFAQRRSKVDEQHQADAAHFARLCPGEDDKRYTRWSRKLLDMRDDERMYAMEGNYRAAITLHQQADEVEASERIAHKITWSRDSERIKKQGIAHKEMVEGAFESWCQRQELKTSQNFDPQIDALTKMIQAIDRDLELLRQKARRLGLSEASSDRRTTLNSLNQ